MWVGIGVGIGRNRFATGIFNDYALRVTADGGITEAGQCVDAVTGLLLNASLLLIPSGYKGGKLYAEIPTNGNGDLTWTRGSDAFRTNASGLIQRVPWNLLQYSEAFDNAYWSKNSGGTGSAPVVTANATTAPDGTNTADKIYFNAGAGTTSSDQSNINRDISSTSGISYRSSIYLKGEIGGEKLVIRGSDGVYSLVTLTTSWQQVNNVAVTSSTTISYNFGIRQGLGGIGTINSTATVYAWGAQLVEGSSAQTYFPTTDRLNVPRLSYMYGSCPSALLEPQRTNLALYSQQFDDATWVKSQSSITANQTTSPDGNTTADTFTGDGNLAQHFVYQNNSLTSGVVYTMSVYAKKNTNDFLQITAGSFLFGVNAFANFNLNNGTIGTVGSSATATITSIANGWYRCTMTATATTTGSGLSALYTLISSSTSARAEINSLATSLFLWGAQLEQGAYPTTYIPTTSATATRIADSFSRSNIYTNGLISASGGTWFVELRNNVAYTRDASSSELYIGEDATSGLAAGKKAILIRNSGGGSVLLSLVYWDGSAIIPLHVLLTSTIKLAIKFNGTTADVFSNGTKVVTSASVSLTLANMQNLNALAGVPRFIQQMALFPIPLSDTDCATLTT